MDAANKKEAVDRLSSCTAAVKRWFVLLNDLLLNADKSDIVAVGTAQQLRSAATPTAVDVAGCSLQVSTHSALSSTTICGLTDTSAPSPVSACTTRAPSDMFTECCRPRLPRQSPAASQLRG